ncbi:hypothetical protein B0T25DRAFT_567026 [Lasiosphaeria hispida]|uniref:Uncharacterized protein n=1 Tax=Lasiosphaeria hispida TaxID=260671 RepID=A0AAJ0MGJ7_9PEZI|nr:hypothetical protein B0T25DRAFT_567026 [Lasiosphaeria hispida]
MRHSKLLLGALGAFSFQHAAGIPLAADPFLTLGYAECQTSTFFGGQLVTGERKDLFVSKGNIDVGCGDWRNAPLGIGTNYQDMKWFQHPVCGVKLNFAPNGNNFDIYQDGHYDLLGTCSPHEGKKAFCPDALNGGTCVVETKFHCVWRGGSLWRPCS